MQMQEQEIKETNAGMSSLPHQTVVGATADISENDDALRVTPEEIALAAAALEAKRDAEHIWRETTLPIAEAIQHLGLNATSQELAPEVVALRAERSRAAAKVRQDQFGRDLGNGLRIFFGLGALVWVGGWLWSSYTHAQHPEHIPSIVPAMATLPIQKLAAVPDNIPVHIDVETLLKLAKGDVKPEEVSVDTRVETSDGAQSAANFNNEWTVVKSKDVLLVKGWATVEFALNITNDSAGALFSARPGWLPANTLVPVQVPVYRLERQEGTRLLPDGKTADSAISSVLMVWNVADTSKAAGELVQDAILTSNTTTSEENFLSYGADGWSHVEVSVTDKTVHLTGNATTAHMKKRAEELAADALKRLHLSYPIANDLVVAPKEP